MHERPTQPRGDDVNLRSAPQLREYHAVVDRIAADAPASILDWGCGLGQVSALLLRAGLNVSSFDYRGDDSPDAVVALPLFPHVRAYVSSDPRALPYDDASFDAVLSCGVLELVHDPDGSLEEIKRVLEPGGTLYVYKLPNRFSYLEKLAKRMGLYYHGAEPHELLYTPASARALLERHGYTIRELRLANMLPLTLDIPVAQRPRVAGAVWAANRALARVPGLNRVATNVELVAGAPAT
jgi:ubiquinone/menaquinone biosynthesis C-methylase UbiE